MSLPVRLGVFFLALCLGAALVVAILGMPTAAVDLPGVVAARMHASGVDHPVTAVLLNFRGYDTLLEVAVLLLALLGMWVVAPGEGSTVVTSPASPVLQTLARLVVPLMILMAGYLLWAGAHRPGGAFQAGAVLAGAVLAGAVLAGAAVLLHLAGLLPAWASPVLLLRLGLAGGFLVFLGVAIAVLGQGALLRYPVDHAGALILLIEAGLTFSLGLILVGLFLVLVGRRARQ